MAINLRRTCNHCPLLSVTRVAASVQGMQVLLMPLGMHEQRMMMMMTLMLMLLMQEGKMLLTEEPLLLQQMLVR